MNSSRTTPASRLAKLWQANAPTRMCYGKNARLRTQIIESFTSLLRSPPKATFLICALALTLPAAFAIFSSSFKSAEENLLLNRHITVFLNTQISDTEANLLATNLATNKLIQSGVVAPINIQGNEILTVVIQPSTELSNASLDHIVRELINHPSVDYVDADAAWLQKNLEAINTTKKLGILSAVLTALVTSILAYGITCTDLLRHQSEYRVLNQMGASRSTLLKPFLLRGILLASIVIFAGSLLAWGPISLIAHLVDTSTYRGIFPTAVPLRYLVSLGLIAIISSVVAALSAREKIFNSYISIT